MVPMSHDTEGDQQGRELSLDPDNWDSIKKLGHRMVDEMVDYLATLRSRPVWRPVPEGTKALLRGNPPEQGVGLEQVYEEFLTAVQPFPTGNIHPRFWGWVRGTGNVEGVLGEMLAAGLNNNVSGFADAATLVELQVLGWCKEWLGYPSDSSGILVSGGSMANLVGLAVARQAMAGYDARAEGLTGQGPRLTVYASEETHASVEKAVELLGIGRAQYRRIPVNDAFEIDVAALEHAIGTDRAAGHRPMAVVGNVGTVNTGAIDDLDALAALCARERLWLHVDGAFGAWGAMVPQIRRRLGSLARADSLAFDLHKWMYVPYEVGCALVKSASSHREAFRFAPEYLVTGDRGAAAGPIRFSDYGVQLSRDFRALKAWFTFKAHGRAKLARLVEQNVGQARFLANLVAGAPELELAAPVALNVVCFRYRSPGADESGLARLNEEILFRLHEEGIAVVSMTRVHEKRVLRVAITNHRTRRDDLRELVAQVLRLGRELR